MRGSASLAVLFRIRSGINQNPKDRLGIAGSYGRGNGYWTAVEYGTAPITESGRHAGLPLGKGFKLVPGALEYFCGLFIAEFEALEMLIIRGIYQLDGFSLYIEF
jgi:hypothetical protein